MHDRVHQVRGFLYQSVADSCVQLQSSQFSFYLQSGQVGVRSQIFPEAEDEKRYFLVRINVRVGFNGRNQGVCLHPGYHIASLQDQQEQEFFR